MCSSGLHGGRNDACWLERNLKKEVYIVAISLYNSRMVCLFIRLIEINAQIVDLHIYSSTNLHKLFQICRIRIEGCLLKGLPLQ